MSSIKILEDWTLKDPLNCIGYCAGVCWNSDTSVTTKNVKRALKCISDGHGRVLELPDIYLVLDGWSAKCLRELYTHIGGAPTRLQASTRYIDYSKDFKVVQPDSIKNNPVASLIWDSTIETISKSMKDLKELDVPVEDFTMLLPLAYESKMVWKVNLRTLINFFEMRLCSRAYWEIRNLCIELKRALSEYSDEWKQLSDLFVPKCIKNGYCTESNSCGLRPKKSEVIK